MQFIRNPNSRYVSFQMWHRIDIQDAEIATTYTKCGITFFNESSEQTPALDLCAGKRCTLKVCNMDEK